MIRINIITVGTLKEKYWKDAVAEYTKRLGRFAKVQVTELEEAYLPSSPSAADIDKALDREGDAIVKRFSPGGTHIALCVEGEMKDSPAFASLLNKAGQQGSIDLVIGSSYGLSAKVKKACSVRLSFSPMTFPHQLMRVVLLEQIYRGFKIINAENYHK